MVQNQTTLSAHNGIYGSASLVQINEHNFIQMQQATAVFFSFKPRGPWDQA